MNNKRGNRGRGRGSSRGNMRVSTQLKHEVAYTVSKYVPPLHPRPREEAFKVRRVLQLTYNLVQDSTTASRSNFSLQPKDWFTTSFSTTGFDMLFLHRVAIWSGIVVPGSGQTVFPVIVAYHNYPAGTQIYPNFRGTCGAYNERARVGYYVPSHLSGPYLSNATQAMITGYATNEASMGTFTVKSITVEIDATFC